MRENEELRTTESSESQTKKPIAIWWYTGGILLSGILAYSNSFSGVFLFDGVACIAQNESIRSLQATWNATRDNVPGGLHRRPIARWTFALNYALGGLNPWGYHLWNLVVHLTAALLLFGIVGRTLLLRGTAKTYQRSATGIAFIVALLWVVHPLHTESVTYIVQRLESMMGMFYLGCLYCTLRGAKAKDGRPWYSLAVVCCCLGMGTKEVMITAPVVVLLYDRIYLARTWSEIMRRRGWMYAGFALAALWLIYITYDSLQNASGPKRVPTPYVPNRWVYLCTQPQVLLHYLRLSFWPQGQCLDYGWRAVESADAVWLPGAVIVGLLAASAWNFWRRPRVGFLGITFFIILAPTSTILPLHLAFEHRMYLPLACVIVLMVLAGHQLLLWLGENGHLSRSAQKRFPIVVVLTVALLLGALTFLRNFVYQSSAAMWGNVVKTAPLNPRGHDSLGFVLMEQESPDEVLEQNLLNEALFHFETALEIEPNNALTRHHYGVALHKLGRGDEAEQQWRTAISIRTDLAEPHHNLAVLLHDQGNLKDAIDHLQTAIKLKPKMPEAHLELANVFLKDGQKRSAAKHFREALRLNPALTEARSYLDDLP